MPITSNNVASEKQCCACLEELDPNSAIRPFQNIANEPCKAIS